MGAVSNYEYHTNGTLDEFDYYLKKIDNRLKRISIEFSSHIELEIEYHYQDTRNRAIVVAQEVIDKIGL